MRKLLIVIFPLLFTLQKVQAQQAPVIKPLQYTIIVDREVKKFKPYLCVRYITGPPPGGGEIHCFDDNDPNPWKGKCAIVDEFCNTCSEGSNRVTTVAIGSTTMVLADEENLSGFAWDETRYYTDTFNLYDAQFGLSAIRTTITEQGIRLPNEASEPGFTTNCTTINSPAEISPAGEFVDMTFTTEGRKYKVKTRIRIIPNLDPTYTLPSHDKIQIQELIPRSVLGYNIEWEYQDTIMALTNSWSEIPSTFYRDSTKLLEISGIDLFGSNYVDFLHSTVKIRARNSSGSVKSAIIPYTLRLSSPHITSVTPTDLDCFEKNEGKVKIQFDRALIPGERLSILMFDTVSKTNYSALNMSELAPDNSYTWANELRAGTYFLSLLGKYAKGLQYDLYVDERIDTVQLYTALNSVNFDDGFNTLENDNFDSYTDYTGYSQATYTGSLTHLAFTPVDQPDKIHFRAEVDTAVRCKGMSTAVITIFATGGMENYKYSLKHVDDPDWSAWQIFEDNTNTLVSWPELNAALWTEKARARGLRAGNYQLRVRDQVDCYPLDPLGNEVIYSFTITEPEKGITLDMLEISPVTHPDSANAAVKVRVSGGTPFLNGEIFAYPYKVNFIDSTTGMEKLMTHTILEQNKRMQSIADDLGEGTYYLRVKDAYYSVDSPYSEGCFLEMKIRISKPQPLLVDIEQRKQINCFDSATAQLMAMPQGGIPIDSLRYTFQWYRVTGEGNDPIAVTDSLITDLGPGNYRVMVTDKYDNTALSPIFTVTEPSAIQLQMSSTPSSCYTTGDGTLTVLATGGTPYESGYKYEWSTGDRTPTVDSVAGGNYLVIVTDSMFCMVMDTVSVTSPVRLIPEVTVSQVTCRGACDGQIAVTTTGGSGVYTYEWSNGATTSAVSNLCPGIYWFKVSDANGCMDSIAIELDNPDTLTLNLGPDRKICIGQTIRLDATASDTAVLTYNWTSTNGFTASAAKVAITQAGTYYVAVSNIRGCILRDTVVVTAENSTINTDFVMSTQAFAGDPVTLVNISQPTTDSVHWILPVNGNNIRINEQNNQRCELVFSDTGRYAITMRAFYPSGCIEDSTKYLNVVGKSGPITTGNPANAFLKAYAVIYPNPSTGTFKVDLEFSEITKARLRLINTLTNIIVDDRQIQGQDEYLLDYNMNPLTNGVYILVIEAAKGSFVYKVIIAH